MHILWVATKSPWPAIDGGRLVAAQTIEGLVAAGHRVTVVAPVTSGVDASPPAGASHRLRLETVAVRYAPPWWDALRAQVGRRPWTLVRHDLPAVRRRVAELVQRGDVDVVHVEQVQALANVGPIDRPVVLRAQNVESDLWRLLVTFRPWLAPWLRLEARRLARAEGVAVGAVAAAVALTDEDAARLATLGGGSASVQVVPAPVDPSLTAGRRQLVGDPPLVLFGSSGWRPNRDGARWFVDQVWPAVCRAHPTAHLHAFGFEGLAPASDSAITCHPAPKESHEALADGAVLVVPLAVASGIRMKILEAWARAIPVIATTVAARGTGAEDGRELWIADDAEAVVAAVDDARRPRRRQAVVAQGRRRLLAEHTPEVVAERLAAIYRSVL